MGIFTVFAFGTGEDIKKTESIISQFARNCSSDKFVIQGSNLLGNKVTVRVREAAAEIIDWLVKQASNKNTINLVGFSRGSITCIRIANVLKKYQKLLEQKVNLIEQDKKLLEQLKELNANIFALDPVAGIGYKKKLAGRQLPSNVTHYVAILQRDEMRREFKPLDMTRLIIESVGETQVSLLPLYGNHSDCLRIKAVGKESTATIAWHTLYQFLKQHGTKFKDDKIPSIINNTIPQGTTKLPEHLDAKQWLILFSQHHSQRAEYFKDAHALKIKDSLIPRKVRTLNNQLKFYVKNSNFFVNSLERGLLKIAYPKVFNYFFERNCLDERYPDDSHCTKEKVIEELKRLNVENPDLFQRLKRRGIKNLDQGIIGEATGFFVLESCASVQQLLPDLVPENVKGQIDQITRLEQLERDVYRLTFRYEREKSELKFFRERSQTKRTGPLRMRVYNLVNYHSELDRSQKYHGILDVMEQEYFKLTKANSSSELWLMLKLTLREYGRTYQISRPAFPREILAELIDIGLSFLKNTIDFIGNLGFIGGSFLYSLGLAMEDLGSRYDELLGELGFNPLKYLAASIALTISVLGYAIKNSFGLKPITELLCSGVSFIRDAAISVVLDVSIDRLDIPEQVPGQEWLDDDSDYGLLRT